MRKILKKHDKRTSSSSLAPVYLQSRVQDTYSHLMQLYHQEGLSALVATVRKALQELHTQKEMLIDRHRSLERRISEIEPVLVSISDARDRVVSSQRRTIEDYVGMHSGNSFSLNE